MSEDSEESTKFIRQRRDLFVVTSLLLLIHFAEVSAIPEISYSGLKLVIGNPNALITGLWILWGYWYFRYALAYWKLEDSPISNIYNTYLNKCLLLELLRELTNYQNKLSMDNFYPHNTAGSTDFLTPSRLSEGPWEYHISEAKFSRKLWSGEVVLEEEVITHKPKNYIYTQIIALIKTIALNFEFTEYSLPFLYGILPLVVHFY
ncbi:MAG: hypothetical protein ACAH12_10185 [Methylophilaceae bacterium]